MNIYLFLIILIALIIIFCIILYNGLRIILTVEKEKSIARYEFKVTMLKIPIFKRTGSKGKDTSEDSASDKDLDSDKESKKEKTSDEERKKEPDKETETKEKEPDKETETKEKEPDKETETKEKESDKGLKEKFTEIKPILKELKKSKRELKKFLKDVLKSIDIKRLEGHLEIGLTDHTTTVKIASWIWSIGAIVNSNKATSLTVNPKFTEQIIDFEGNLELKINLLKLIIYSLILVTKKNIRELIKVAYKYKKDSDKEKEITEKEPKTEKEKEITEELPETEKEKESNE